MNWYEAAFRSDYLRVYRHRDDASAAREADFFRRVTELGAGAAVLDLACGAGRHARPLAALGFRVTALDLSGDLLREASRNGTPGLVRADMRRLPLAPESQSGVVSFFTSFGYFEDEAEDRRMLAEVSRVLAPGGRYLLDFLNRDRAIADLVPRSEDRVEDLEVIQERWIDEARLRVEKAVTIRRVGDEGPGLRYVESVRLYAEEDIRTMLAGAGLRTVTAFGDFDGASYDAAASGRLLVLAERP